MWELKKNYDDGYVVHPEYVYVYETWDMDRLHSPESLMEDGGWDKVVAERSVRAVKKAVSLAKSKLAAAAEVPPKKPVKKPAKKLIVNKPGRKKKSSK
jgi:hypothetical protein